MLQGGSTISTCSMFSTNVSSIKQSLSSIKQSLFHAVLTYTQKLRSKAMYTQEVKNFEDRRNRQDFVLGAHPSEQRLIELHLRPHVVSGDKSCSFIHDGDVYADHPNVLTRRYAAAVSSNGNQVWYFFTPMRARGARRKGRKVDSGEGFWHTESEPKAVVSANRQLLGYRRYLKFARKEGSQRVRSKWVMMELGLHNDGQDKVTLCKVYLSLRPYKTRKGKAAADNKNDPAHRRARKMASLLNRASCS